MSPERLANARWFFEEQRPPDTQWWSCGFDFRDDTTLVSSVKAHVWDGAWRIEHVEYGLIVVTSFHWSRGGGTRRRFRLAND